MSLSSGHSSRRVVPALWFGSVVGRRGKSHVCFASQSVLYAEGARIRHSFGSYLCVCVCRTTHIYCIPIISLTMRRHSVLCCCPINRPKSIFLRSLRILSIKHISAYMENICFTNQAGKKKQISFLLVQSSTHSSDKSCAHLLGTCLFMLENNQSIYPSLPYHLRLQNIPNKYMC